MNRENLIHRLVERKLASGAKSKVFCICLVRANGTPAAKRAPLRAAKTQ